MDLQDQDTMSPTLDQYLADLDEQSAYINQENETSPRDIDEASLFDSMSVHNASSAEEVENDTTSSVNTDDVDSSIQYTVPLQLSTQTAAPAPLRPVPFVQNALHLARQSLVHHENEVTAHTTRISQSIRVLAQLIRGEGTFETAMQVLRQHTESKIDDIRNHIEETCGHFNATQSALVQDARRLDTRLLRVLYIGLLRQELASGRLGPSSDPGYRDKDASCLLEARAWILEVLQRWSYEIEQEIRTRTSV